VSAPDMSLSSLASLWQKFSQLVEILQSSDKNNFAVFLDTVYFVNNLNESYRAIIIFYIDISTWLKLCEKNFLIGKYLVHL